MSSSLRSPLPNAKADTFLLLILSSPSGAGKTTLKNRLLEHHPDLRFSVSHTTRKPRANEVDGREYHFVDRPTFERMIGENAFAEWAEVHGNLYGTSLQEIEAARSTHSGIVFDIDYQGARQVRAVLPDVITVFILPPSMQELERRLRTRAADTEEVVCQRLKNARREIENYSLFDYLLVNDDVDAAEATLNGILLAERARRCRMAPLGEHLLRSGALR